jgi:excisionase family DNA binding protein
MTDDTTTSGELLLTFAQAAQRLRLGVLDIRRMVRTEQCPIVRDGRRVRIPAAWVDNPQGYVARALIQDES